MQSDNAEVSRSREEVVEKVARALRGACPDCGHSQQDHMLVLGCCDEYSDEEGVRLLCECMLTPDAFQPCCGKRK